MALAYGSASLAQLYDGTAAKTAWNQFGFELKVSHRQKLEMLCAVQCYAVLADYPKCCAVFRRARFQMPIPSYFCSTLSANLARLNTTTHSFHSPLIQK